MISILSRFNCTGFKLRLPGPWQLELWYCPRGAVIPEHVHESIDSRLVFLGGRMVWSHGWKRKLFTWRDLFRSFKVPRYEHHAAEVAGRFGLFLNIERWFGPKTSAAVDLRLA